MPDDINAETLPLVNPAALGTLLGLDADDIGVQYAAEPIVYQRARSIFVDSGNHVLGASFENWIIAINSSSAATFTVNNDTTLAWAVNARCRLLRRGSGTFTVVAGSGVTLLTAGRPKLRAQGSMAELIKIEANVWVLSGDTSA
jgi:hypothetical protein